MSRQITPHSTLENLKKEAKRWLKALRAGGHDARVRLERAWPNAPVTPTLRDVQRALALEHGLSGWTALKARLTQDAPISRYERVAEALVTAYATREMSAMQIVWAYFGHMRAWDAMRRYIRVDLGKREQPQSPEDDVITLAEARFLVARAQGFESWDALETFVASLPPGKTDFATKAIGIYRVDASGSKQDVTRSRDWDEVVAIMKAKRLTGLHASGQMTDALLERISHLDHITSFDLDGSKQLTDDGLRFLARLPQLRRLNLAGCAITDRGLEVLRHLPGLESIVLAWTPITDEGAKHLAACENLKTVNLSGTATGDGALGALAGKRNLRHFESGNEVTNAGLALLQGLPRFKKWHGGGEDMTELRTEDAPNFLMLRGRFTDQGMAHLVGLDGLFALNIDSNRLAVTGAGLSPLTALPHLTVLAFDAKDESMPYIAALPHLRFLMCQDTAAGDDGFVALSRSQSIEHIWGRRCYNLQRRGFTALANMPALRYLSVSCKNVDDVGLAALPHFPALKELMPMDVPDAGYRHVGACAQLESLVLMYCRDTTDAATEHIVNLRQLKKYFVSYNQITDRTPEMLAGIASLEAITFDTCAQLTNAGIAALALLPNLRELRVSGMPNVTREVVVAFPPHVHVNYSI